VECHTDEDALKGSLGAQEQEQGSLSKGEDWAGELPAAEAWQLVYIDGNEFFETMHGRYGCTTCHGGEGDTKLKETAHREMINEPSTEGVCWNCHVEEVAGDLGSLHTNLTGYRTVLAARSAPEKMPLLEEMMGNHCEPCHTATCGQCHVSRPSRLGGGLVAGHVFENTPAINLTCAGCHGSRIEDEYRGHNGAVPGDVHWVQAKMLCSNCHTGREFHGQVDEYVHRYDGQPLPACDTETCHPDVAEDDGIEQHGDDHLKLLSCQACHSTTYKNCYGCHVAMASGKPYFEVEPPQLAFKIGRNPLRDRYRTWKYVPLRHVPITPDSFSYYGMDLLPSFDALPTWKYTTPHNIQRITPQTESCNACHGNADLFLTVDDLLPNEVTANRSVIVKEIPIPVDESSR
jgi:thiosulfate/3-mercaptopyruvate sulfurtransferase